MRIQACVLQYFESFPHGWIGYRRTRAFVVVVVDAAALQLAVPLRCICMPMRVRTSTLQSSVVPFRRQDQCTPSVIMACLGRSSHQISPMRGQESTFGAAS
jgi:hypothetical protein